MEHAGRRVASMQLYMHHKVFSRWISIQHLMRSEICEVIQKGKDLYKQGERKGKKGELLVSHNFKY